MEVWSKFDIRNNILLGNRTKVERIKFLVTLASLQLNTLVQVLKEWKNLNIIGGTEAEHKLVVTTLVY